MNNFFTWILFIFIGFFGISQAADTVVWSGKVDSDGMPSKSIQLILGKTYRVKVSGTINLGKWRTNKQPLENDACYEFFADPKFQEKDPKKIDTFRSSIPISVCDGKYHSDHIYTSEPFLVAQSGIHFWIHDTDYSDNTGALDVEVIQINQ